MAKNPNRKNKPAPKPVSAGSQMIARMREGTKTFEIINWPGKTEELAIVVLHEDVLQECYAGAGRRFKELGMKLDVYNADDFHNEINIQVLARSMYTVIEKDGAPHPGALLFSDADDYRKVSRMGERDLLGEAFLNLQQETNPDPGKTDAETFDAITEAVKKKDVACLSAFGSNTLSLYMIGMEDPPPS